MRNIIWFIIGVFMSFSSVQAEEKTVVAPIITGHFDDNGLGRSAQILDAVFKKCKWQVKYRQYPFGQHWTWYERNKSFDAVALPWAMAKVKGYQSDAFIHQKNGVVFLESSKQEIKSLADLKGKRVYAFAGASKLFPVLKKAQATFASYKEISSGINVTNALRRKEIDAFITDGLVFVIAYHHRITSSAGYYGDKDWPKIKFSAIFPENSDHMLFRNNLDRKQFNGCLRDVKAAGTIKAISKKFVDRFKEVLEGQIPLE